MMQRANRSLHVAQGSSQNFVPKSTYLLKLNLLMFKIQQKLVYNKGVCLVSELAIDWFLWYVETNLLKDHWLSTLISRLCFSDGPLSAIYQNIHQNIPNPREHNKWMKQLQNTEMAVSKLVTKQVYSVLTTVLTLEC